MPGDSIPEAVEVESEDDDDNATPNPRDSILESNMGESVQ